MPCGSRPSAAAKVQTGSCCKLHEANGIRLKARGGWCAQIAPITAATVLVGSTCSITQFTSPRRMRAAALGVQWLVAGVTHKCSFCHTGAACFKLTSPVHEGRAAAVGTHGPPQLQRAVAGQLSRKLVRVVRPRPKPPQLQHVRDVRHAEPAILVPAAGMVGLSAVHLEMSDMLKQLCLYLHRVQAYRIAHHAQQTCWSAHSQK